MFPPAYEPPSCPDSRETFTESNRQENLSGGAKDQRWGRRGCHHKRCPYRGDSADLPPELRAVAGTAERALLHRLAAVDGPVGGGADVEGVVHVVVELVGVGGVLLTGGQDLARLGREGDASAGNGEPAAEHAGQELWSTP